jgi:hypothetical protein
MDLFSLHLEVIIELKDFIIMEQSIILVMAKYFNLY